MYTKYTVAFLFCLASTVADATTFTITRKLVCDKIDNIAKIVGEYGERLVWTGSGQNNLYSTLTINRGTGSWSLILTDGELGCVLDSGVGFKVEDGREEPKQAPKSSPVPQLRNIVLPLPVR